jgi:isocitrate dehydrogenase (NAD+)
MVDYLGEKDISNAIFKATENVIDDNVYVTYDLGGNSTLSRMAEEIADRASRILKK